MAREAYHEDDGRRLAQRFFVAGAEALAGVPATMSFGFGVWCFTGDPFLSGCGTTPTAPFGCVRTCGGAAVDKPEASCPSRG